MNSKKLYYVLLGVIGLLFVGLLAGAYEVDQVLSSKSDHLVSLKLKSQVLATQQTGLIKAKKEVKTYSSLNDIAKTIVPQDKDQAEAVLEISNLAEQSGIGQLSGVTFPVSTLGGLPGAIGTSGTGTPTTPAAGSAGKSNLTQLLPVKGTPGLYELQITIQQASDNPVGYNQFLTFLSKLEQNRRTAQVTSISLKPSSQDPSLVGFTLIVNEFIRP